jgi:hypothetical protein
MKKTAIIQRLEKIVESEFNLLKDNTILWDNDQYHAFEQYTISKNNDGTFNTVKHLHEPKVFSSLKVALSWCIADKYHYTELAFSILKLDQERKRLSNDVTVRVAMLQRIQDLDRRETAQLKVKTKKNRLDNVNNHLTKCVNLAKYYQIRGFNRDETARTKRNTPTR